MESMQQQLADALRRIDGMAEQLRLQEAESTRLGQELDDALAARGAGLRRPGPEHEVRRRGIGVDTRTLGRPDTFHGEDAKFKDWSVVLRSYVALVNTELQTAMRAAEQEAGTISNATTVSDEVKQASDCTTFSCRRLAAWPWIRS